MTKAKARLVAKDNSQLEGAAYLETFAPTPATALIRMLKPFACKHNLNVHHFDLNKRSSNPS